MLRQIEEEGGTRAFPFSLFVVPVSVGRSKGGRSEVVWKSCLAPLVAYHLLELVDPCSLFGLRRVGGDLELWRGGGVWDDAMRERACVSLPVHTSFVKVTERAFR